MLFRSLPYTLPPIPFQPPNFPTFPLNTTSSYSPRSHTIRRPVASSSYFCSQINAKHSTNSKNTFWSHTTHTHLPTGSTVGTKRQPTHFHTPCTLCETDKTHHTHNTHTHTNSHTHPSTFSISFCVSRCARVCVVVSRVSGDTQRVGCMGG